MTTPETTPPQPLTPTEPAATETYRPNDAASELVKVLDQYLADLQAGRAPDRAQLLAAHPELGSQLESCLAGIEFIHRAAQPSSGAPTRLGDFRIVREIGRGGMGVVYEAEQLSLKRRVALKVLRFGAVADAEVLQRFQREAQTVAHLHHTNIVPIFAVGCEQGVHYYAMQFIEGRSLAAVLTEAQLASRPLAAKEVARWGLQAAEALAYAHQRGVIHRDIKPSNLLLDPEGTLWLTDFGLAKRADEVTLTLAGTLMGTPRYMSPEQAAAMEQPVDHRTDIYSLGASLYELATSKPVFEAESPHAVLTQIRSAEPVAPRRWTRGLPRDLETIILKCLAKEPARRYATAQALADDLRAFLDGRGIKARRASLVERSRRWARRHPRSVTAAVTGVAAALLIVGGFFGWNWYQEARLGSLTLTTDGPPLVAEILDDQEAQVLPAFTVPTQQPVRVRAGNYRVRLSGQDQLSEDYHVCIPRNSLTVGHVSLGERQLWEPIDIKRDESFEAVDLAGHADVLIAGQDHLRCLDGATAKPLWDTAAEGHGLQLVRPAADLNGDGVPDLVWASQRWPSLMAVSGKDGKVLWQHQARPNMPKTGQVIDSRDVIDSRVLGQPILAEVEGQGRLDVLATFSWYGNLQEPGKAAINLRVATWVEAISGRTGQMLWRRDLVPMSPTPGPPNMDASIAAAQVTRLGGKPVVAVVCDNHLAVLDLKSGEPVAPLRDLPFQPGAGITFGDFNGPRRPNPGIQFGNFNGPGVLLQSPDISTPKTLAAVSLQTGKPVWQMTYPTGAPTPGNEAPGQYLPLVADLDGTGQSEVVVAHLGQQGTSWTDVEAFDGSGQSRWSHRLGLSPNFHIQARLVAGPDLDGDGVREVFVAAVLQQDPKVYQAVLVVAALSGKDGHSLWESRRPVETYGPVGTLTWWETGQDNLPELVVPQQRQGFLDQWSLAIYAAGTGRLVHVVPEFGNPPQEADLNGDGLPDLCGRSGDKLHALLGAEPEAWRWFGGPWQPIHDCDGDGTADLVTTWDYRWLLFISGRDGHVLHQVEGGFGQQLWYVPQGDVDGDGVAEVFVLGLLNSGYVLQAVSGKTGQVLWKNSLGIKKGQELDGLYLDCRDLDGDGRPEVIFAYVLHLHNQGNQNQLWLAVLSGTDGRVKWRQPLSEPVDWMLLNMTGNRVPGIRIGGDIDPGWYQPGLGDLDGDGRPDLAVWGLAPDNKPEVRALRGSDGQLLWRRPLFEHPLNMDSAGGETRVVRVGDLDGDGKPEVVAVGHEDRMVNGQVIAGQEDPQVIILRGTTGEVLGTWKPPANPSGLPEWLQYPPFLVDLESNRRGVVVVHNNTGLGDDLPIVVLDAHGRAVQKGLINRRWPHLRDNLQSADLDGDGKSEMVLFTQGKVRATRGGIDQVMWEVPLPGGAGSLVDIVPPGKDYPATVAIFAGGELLGLDGRTGRERWRCATPRGPAQPYSTFYPSEQRMPATPFTTSLVRTDDPQGRPLAVFEVMFGTGVNAPCSIARPTHSAAVAGK